MSTTHNSTRGMTLTSLADFGAVLDCQTLSPASETPAEAKGATWPCQARARRCVRTWRG